MRLVPAGARPRLPILRDVPGVPDAGGLAALWPNMAQHGVRCLVGLWSCGAKQSPFASGRVLLPLVSYGGHGG